MSLILNSYRPTRIIDFFNNPKSTGYKTYNVFFENLIINTEIQVMTKKMREWTNKTHDAHNLRKYGKVLKQS